MPSGFTMQNSMSGRIAVLTAGVEERAREALEDFAGEVEEYAKENAPWNDITGAARDGLTASVSQEGTTLYLELYHTVDHGVWLEVIQSGRFAIIMPTLETYSSEIFDTVGAHTLGEDEE